jgi:hypothetical protein
MTLPNIDAAQSDSSYRDVPNVSWLSVAVKKGAILAPLAPGGPPPSRMSLSLLLGGVVQNGPERSRARRY